MESMQINQTVEIIPMLGYELKKAGGYHVGACPFCGGSDRFTVKRTPQGDRWHCRQCGDGKYHTVIDYVMRRDNVPFKTALQTLGGDTLKNIPIAPRPKPTAKPLQIPAQDWQGETWRELDAASDALLYHPQGKAARDFLTLRGISFAMWELYKLGFMFYSPKDKPTVKIPVITIPWYDLDAGGEVVTAVKYRVMKKDSSLRYFSKAGSKFDAPFGLFDAVPLGMLPARFEYHHTLLLVEGELNCISVRQCAPRGVSVLSLGNEGSGDDIRALSAIAKWYQRVHIWADDIWTNPKPEKIRRAKELRTLITGKALRSVKQDDGIKQDANQLLQAGLLAGFLSHVLDVECQASHL